VLAVVEMMLCILEAVEVVDMVAAGAVRAGAGGGLAGFCVRILNFEFCPFTAYGLP